MKKNSIALLSLLILFGVVAFSAYYNIVGFANTPANSADKITNIIIIPNGYSFNATLKKLYKNMDLNFKYYFLIY